MGPISVCSPLIFASGTERQTHTGTRRYTNIQAHADTQTYRQTEIDTLADRDTSMPVGSSYTRVRARYLQACFRYIKTDTYRRTQIHTRGCMPECAHAYSLFLSPSLPLSHCPALPFSLSPSPSLSSSFPLPLSLSLLRAALSIYIVRTCACVCARVHGVSLALSQKSEKISLLTSLYRCLCMCLATHVLYMSSTCPSVGAYVSFMCCCCIETIDDEEVVVPPAKTLKTD